MDQQNDEIQIQDSNSTIYQLLETDDMLNYIQQLNKCVENSQIGNQLEGLILSCIKMIKFEHFKLAYQLYMVKFNNLQININILSEVINTMNIRFVAFMIYTLGIVNDVDRNNQTLLLAAIANEDLTIIRLLLINQAQIQVPNVENMMDYALERDLIRVVRLLIVFNNAKPIKEQNIQKYKNLQTKWYELGFKQKLIQTYKENEGIKRLNFRKFILSFYFMVNIVLSLMIPIYEQNKSDQMEQSEQIEQSEQMEQTELIRWGCITIIVFTMIIHIFLCCFNNALPKPNLPLDVLIDTNFDQKNLCLHCGSTKDEDTKHCDRCHSCIPKQSHHCIWIDNCVGGQIKITFSVFVISLIFICLFQILLAILILIDKLKQKDTPIFGTTIQQYYQSIAITLLIINGFPFTFFLYALTNKCKAKRNKKPTQSNQVSLLNGDGIQAQDLSQES